MIDSSREVDLGGFEWVIGWEVYGKEEDAALEWTIALKCGILISHLLSVTVTCNFRCRSRQGEYHILDP
jgi:hypothetical protein